MKHQLQLPFEGGRAGIKKALTFLASVAIHVGLQRAGSSEPFVANFALVLLLRARRYLGAELAHHRLRRRWYLAANQTMGPRQCPS
jgi:hypothetical protein